MFSAKVAHVFSCHGWWEPLSKTEQTQWQRWKSKKDTGFSVLLWFHQLTSWQWLPWWFFSSPTLYWVPYGPWGSPSEILAMMKSIRGLSSPYNRLPLVTLRKSLIALYLSFSREYNAFLFDRGVMRTNSWCLGTTSCEADNRHRKVCVGHWTHSILMTLESKRAFKSKHHWLNTILSEWQPVNFLA